MYIEILVLRRLGDKVRLISFIINGNFVQCVSFYYYMYGLYVKVFNVYLVIGVNVILGSFDWIRVGIQVNVWVLGQLQIVGGLFIQGVINVSKIKY